MLDRTLQEAQRSSARLAGFMLLFVFLLFMVGWQLMAAGPSRHDFGVWCTILASVCTAVLAYGLYLALKPVDLALAGIALSLRLFEAGTGVFSSSLNLSVFRSSLERSSAGAFASNLMHTMDRMNVGTIVFSLGSVIFFYLFFRSRYIPRILSGFGVFASLAVTTACVVNLMNPAYPVMSAPGMLPIVVAEVATGFWLLIKSVRVESVA